jgi:hypothetical protein
MLYVVLACLPSVLDIRLCKLRMGRVLAGVAICVYLSHHDGGCFMCVTHLSRTTAPLQQKAWFLRVGIALLEKNGVHDGTVDDHAYFSCEDGHGILVKPEKVEVLMAGFATSSKWHQKVFMKGVAKEAAAEALVQKKRDEEDKKLEKKKKKDLLTGRYQQPSTGFADSDAAVKADEGVKVKHSSGGDGEAASTQAPPLVRHSDTQDEYDPQAQYAVSAEHVGTLRRKVGSRTYLFEQVGDEHAESVVSKSFGSLSGMYVEVATWTFWNQQSADTYLAKWTDVLEDDRAAEAYTGVFKKPASADDGKEVRARFGLHGHVEWIRD